MYTPSYFAETDLTKLHDFIESHSFGVLNSAGPELRSCPKRGSDRSDPLCIATPEESEQALKGSDPFFGQLMASHLPFLLRRRSGPRGTLIGHMARANPQWQQADGTSVLVIFAGPHAYVSPTWYEARDVVPTWNYVAVHVYGTLRLIDEPGAVTEIVRETVDRYERGMPRPWSLEDSAGFVERLVRMIIGFEIEITYIEGKWKLSQNHSLERRERVIRGLLASADPAAHAVARLMQESLVSRSGSAEQDRSVPRR